MRRSLLIFAALFAIATAGPAAALESGVSCEIADDTVQPDILKDLERILREINRPAS